MNVGQKRRRKRKITMTTRAMLRTNEVWTSSTEARMVVVRSLRMERSTDGGIQRSNWGNSALIRSTVSMTFAPACLEMMTNTAGFMPDQPPRRLF